MLSPCVDRIMLTCPLRLRQPLALDNGSLFSSRLSSSESFASENHQGLIQSVQQLTAAPFRTSCAKLGRTLYISSRGDCRPVSIFAFEIHREYLSRSFPPSPSRLSRSLISEKIGAGLNVAEGLTARSVHRQQRILTMFASGSRRNFLTMLGLPDCDLASRRFFPRPSSPPSSYMYPSDQPHRRFSHRRH
jgi:hypothetical protein